MFFAAAGSSSAVLIILPNPPITENTFSQKVLNKFTDSDIIKTKDIVIQKSVGAKAKNYDIIDPNSGEHFSFVEGTWIQDAQVFAGYHTHNPLDDEVKAGLAEQYGGDLEKWQHCKGVGHIKAEYEDVLAEVHWFQEKTAGKHVFKVKEWLDYDS